MTLYKKGIDIFKTTVIALLLTIFSATTAMAAEKILYITSYNPDNANVVGQLSSFVKQTNQRKTLYFFNKFFEDDHFRV